MNRASTGYIREQACPTFPEHGETYITDTGYYCPHSGHWKPGNYTKDRWTFEEWQRIHDPTAGSPPRAQNKPRSNRVGKEERKQERSKTTKGLRTRARTPRKSTGNNKKPRRAR